MKLLKSLFIYFVNIIIGYISAVYLLLAVFGGIQEEEDMRWFGVIMLLFWIVIVVIINIGLIKIFIGNVKENLQLFYRQKFLWKNFFVNYIAIGTSLLLGGIMRMIYLYYSYDVR